MDYANASAGKATLALVKLAYTATPRLGTLFVNPGSLPAFWHYACVLTITLRLATHRI